MSPSNSPESKSLLISASNKKLLNKNQIAFNKLTDQIEKAKKNIENKRQKLDYALKLFANELSPLKVELVADRREMLLILWDLYKSERLSKTDQRSIKSITREHLQSLFSELNGPPDASLRAIFEELEKMKYDEIEALQKETFRNELLSILKSMKVDISQIDIHDEKVIESKIIEERQKQKFKNNASYEETIFNQKKAKTKSAKQQKVELVKKNKDEIKHKSISSIYKQLAKQFHPDLEQDEEKKAQKVSLMQELTAAYMNKDLYTLLNLELKWLQADSDYLDKLDDDKLESYLLLLKEQFSDLNSQKNNLIFQPHYSILVNEFGWQVNSAPVDTVIWHISDAKMQMASFKQNIELLKSDRALRYVKQLIKEWKSQLPTEYY